MKGKISHINLSISNIERSIEFYNQLLFPIGFKKGLNESGKWGAVRGYKGKDVELEIIHDRAIKYKPFTRYVGLNHICFEVDTKKDVDKMYKLVKTLGVKITRKPRKYPSYTKRYYAFYFRDPDGIPLEIALV